METALNGSCGKKFHVESERDNSTYVYKEYIYGLRAARVYTPWELITHRCPTERIISYEMILLPSDPSLTSMPR